MKKLLAALKSDKSGASAAEYALIIAVFGGFVVLGMTALGSSFEGAMEKQGEYLETKTDAMK